MSPTRAIFNLMLHMDISSMNAKTMSTLFIDVFTLSRTGIEASSIKH